MSPSTSSITNHENTSSNMSKDLDNHYASNQQQRQQQYDSWTRLLQIVSGSSDKDIPVKNILILGSDHSGKNSLVNGLKARQVSDIQNLMMQSIQTKSSCLPLNYATVDVQDEESIDTVARLGIYSLAGNHHKSEQHVQLIANLFQTMNQQKQEQHEKIHSSPLNDKDNSKQSSTKTNASPIGSDIANKLPNHNLSLFDDFFVVICLSWDKPWEFVESIFKWIQILEDAIEKANIDPKSTEFAKNCILRHFKSFNQTSSTHHTSILSTTNNNHPHQEELASSTIKQLNTQMVDIPLEEGVLYRNIGLPIAIVCTKSDMIQDWERSLDESSFENIQQTLRTLCLTYGASLFHTSSKKPTTIQDLKMYLMHRLFKPKNQYSSLTFTFDKKPQVLDRETIMIPSGWDSLGKIKIIRKEFDCQFVAGIGFESRQEAERTIIQTFKEDMLSGLDKKKETKNTQVEIKPEDEQMFLRLQAEVLDSSNPPSTSSSSILIGGGVEDHSSSLSSVSATPSPMRIHPIMNPEVTFSPSIQALKTRTAAAASASSTSVTKNSGLTREQELAQKLAALKESTMSSSYSANSTTTGRLSSSYHSTTPTTLKQTFPGNHTSSGGRRSISGSRHVSPTVPATTMDGEVGKMGDDNVEGDSTSSPLKMKGSNLTAMASSTEANSSSPVGNSSGFVAAPSGSIPSTQNEVLANFFQSLLNKK